MNAIWSEAKVKASHRMAMHLRVDQFRLVNQTPMVSFTFDDVPKSAATSGARILEAHDAREPYRSIMPGVNSGTVDLQFLRALPLIDRCIDRDEIERAFDEAQTTNGWLIFYSHDVADRPSPYGCSPALMNQALEAAARRKIPVLNIAEALLCAGA
jgi:hypothetical protein